MSITHFKLKVKGFFRTQSGKQVPTDIIKEKENESTLMDLTMDKWDQFKWWKFFREEAEVAIDSAPDVYMSESKSEKGYYSIVLTFKPVRVLSDEKFTRVENLINKSTKPLTSYFTHGDAIFFHPVQFTVTPVRLPPPKPIVQPPPPPPKRTSRKKNTMYKGSLRDPKDLQDSYLSKAFVYDSD